MSNRVLCQADGSWSEILTLSSAGATSPQSRCGFGGKCDSDVEHQRFHPNIKSTFRRFLGHPYYFGFNRGISASIAVDTSGNVVAIWAASGAIESSTKLFGGSWPTTPDVLAASGGSHRKLLSALLVRYLRFGMR